MSESWCSTTVAGQSMDCFLAMPDGAGPFPGVLVCMHGPGIDDFIEGMARRLAESGFAAIAPDLYHRDPDSGDQPPAARMGRLRDATLLLDLAAAAAYLRAISEVDGERIATMGFCMGGRIAYLHATADARLRAAVVFYGGNILRPWGEGPSPLERSAAIACPVLGLFGDEDGNPSPADVARIDAELKRLGKPHEFHSYAGAGHAFLNHTRPSYRPEAASDAWERCIAMLQLHLGGAARR